jgi:hypothetical protein
MLEKLDFFEGCPTYYEVYTQLQATTRLVRHGSHSLSLSRQRLATEVERLEEPGAQATGDYIECFAYFKKTIEPNLDELVAIPEYHPGIQHSSMRGCDRADPSQYRA